MKNLDINNTIAGIATALSNSGISIIRISGDRAVDIVRKIFFSKNHKPLLDNLQSHKIYYGFVFNGDNIVDEVLVSVFLAPKSYTAEDVVEINCHGGILVTEKIMELLIKNGAKVAEPGEFTKRAFLNGRLDLSEAEAVMDVINARSELSLKVSSNQLLGNVSSKVKMMREKILYEIAFIESAIDDPEHYSTEGYEDKLSELTEYILGETEKLLNSYNNGKIIKDGINTVIIGRPNAGKSSLLNTMLGEEKAIVTDIEGTTRDSIEESIKIKGISLNLIDTAGIRDTFDPVEKIGVKRAIDYANKAELILYVADISSGLDENDIKIIDIINKSSGKTIIVLNKNDLESVIDENKIIEKINDKNISICRISTVEKTGIDELYSIIEDYFLGGQINIENEVYITNIRHKNALEEVRKSINNVKESIDMGMPEDFYSIDLMDAYEMLGKITGESVDDDLVNEIFSKFCMGK